MTPEDFASLPPDVRRRLAAFLHAGAHIHREHACGPDGQHRHPHGQHRHPHGHHRHPHGRGRAHHEAREHRGASSRETEAAYERGFQAGFAAAGRSEASLA